VLHSFQADALSGFGSLDILVFDLHGFYDLFKIGCWSLDEYVVTCSQRRCEFNYGDADFGEEMRYVSNLNNIFLAQTAQSPTSLMHIKDIKNLFKTPKPKR
jgi:hypothetical protein